MFRVVAYTLVAMSLIAAPTAYGQEETGGEAPSESTTADEASTDAAPDPKKVEVARLYADAARNYFKAGQYAEALAEYQKAFEIVPNASLMYNIARCHERLSQWQDAIDSYERYLKLAKDPRDKAETLDKIELLKKRTAPEDSGPDAQYKARINAGRKAYSAGDYERAIEDFKAAFDIKPTSGALFNIAKAYEKMARYEEAIDFFQQYLELDPNASDKADVEETIRRLKRSIKSRFQELSVSSDPPGADIYLDDRNSGIKGQTNNRLKIPPGPHTLYLDLNGYEPIKRDFVMPDDKPLALDFKLTKLENVGMLDITVNQDGARIFVDGAIIGLSPYRQQKQVKQGVHQVTVELIGYNRWTADFQVNRDQTVPVKVELTKYEAPVSDETLTAWGRNLMLIGIIGGGLGFAGPFAYQKLIRGRPYYEDLGPENVNGDPYYRGQGTRSNGQLNAFELTQLISLVAGGVLTAGGFAFYIYKWARTVPPAPVTSSLPPESNFQVTVENFGLVPHPNGEGASFGLSGSF